MSFLINIDNGGTFTDVCVIDGSIVYSAKTLTTPYDLTKCFIEGLKAASQEIYGEVNLQSLIEETDFIRYSTTAGTNSIVQRKGPRLGLILSEDRDMEFLFRSEMEKEMFDAMVDNRISKIGIDNDRAEFEGNLVESINHLLTEGANRLVISIGGSNLIEEEKKIRNAVLKKYPRHLLGAVPVLFSHELDDDSDDARRTWGSLINSFLHPGMERFLFNAENVLRDYRAKKPMLIFHNDGNSARIAKTTAIKTYGSGPRGGLEGAKALAEHYQISSLVTMDIGGTTTDIGLIKDGRIQEKLHGEVEGIEVPFSLSDLISVGAGGSSVFRVENGEMCVGPESVGAAPGPACFARGGEEPTITDAYLLMGILNSNSYFGGSLTLDPERAITAINKKLVSNLNGSFDECLLEMEEAYAKKIAQGLKQYIQQAGSETTLLAFGGAGPMSACGVAEASGIKKIIVPRLAAIFSAFGINFSDIAHSYQASLPEMNESIMEEKRAILTEKAERDMFAEGFDIGECSITTEISFYHNNEYIRLDYTPDLKAFTNGLDNVTDLRMHLKVIKPISNFTFNKSKGSNESTPQPIRLQKMLESSLGWTEIPVYRFVDLPAGATASGPALIEDNYFTCRVLEGWTFVVNENKDIIMQDERGI